MAVEVLCYNGKSGASAKVEVDTAPFGDKVRKRLLRQALLHYAAAHRQGTHSTLSRSEVNKNERKPWRQKGTGRARAGDFASPIWRGGGVAHGPKPRSYTSAFPRRMRREALKSALLNGFSGGQIRFVEELEFSEPKTKKALEILRGAGVTEKERTLVVIAERGAHLFKSFRNLRHVRVVEARDLNAEHLLLSRHVVMERRALDQLLDRIARDAREPASGEGEASVAEEASDA